MIGLFSLDIMRGRNLRRIVILPNRQQADLGDVDLHRPCHDKRRS